MTQAEAHDALFGFLRAKQARGSKVVLVITGKGARGGDDGRPRRAQPHGAALAAAAGIPRRYPGLRERRASHGGEGALYVSLRKARARRL